MKWFWATVVVAVFAAVIEALSLPARAGEVGGRARQCLQVLHSSDLTDDQKESALRQHALRLFVLLGVLAGGSLLALAVPLGAVWCLDRLDLASLPDVWATLQRLDFLTAVSLTGFIVWIFLHRRNEA